MSLTVHSSKFILSEMSFRNPHNIPEMRRKEFVLEINDNTRELYTKRIYKVHVEWSNVYEYIFILYIRSYM